MDPQTIHNTAEGLDRIHDLNGAIAAYESLLELDPGHHDGRSALARLYMEVSRYPDAHALCEAGLAIEPSAPVLAALSECYQAHFRAADAIALAQRAIEQDIGCGYAWFVLSAAFGLAGEDRPAEDAITDGIAVAPDSPDLLVEYATRPQLSPSQQVTELETVRQRFPWHRGAASAYAIALSSAAQEDRATEVRLELLEQNPQSHFNQAIHAMHLIMHGRHEEARPYTAQALELWPTSFYALYSQFHLHLHDAQLALANQTLDQADLLTQGTSLHASFVTQMMVTIDGPEGPRELLESYVLQRPQSISMRLAYAELHQLCEDPDAALMQLRIARRDAPDRYDLIIAEARLLYEARALEDAAQLLAPLDDSQEVDALKTQIAAHEASDPDTIRGIYEAHLARYPQLDFAWGALFRDAIDRSDVMRVTELSSEPFRVPALPTESAAALCHAQLGDFEAAGQALERVLAAPRVAIHWVWSWEFAVKATESTQLGLFRTRIRDAAREDGYLFD